MRMAANVIQTIQCENSILHPKTLIELANRSFSPYLSPLRQRKLKNTLSPLMKNTSLNKSKPREKSECPQFLRLKPGRKESNL